MMKMLSAFTAFAALAVIAAPASAAAVVGQPAPSFTLADTNGRSVSLSDFRGKTVVLEWHNPGCPFVRKHYDSRNMQRAQTAAARDGVVWLTINSGAPGKQGHMSGAEANALLARAGARPAAYLLDPRGDVGRAYEARTTPHMYIVNRAGTLVYAGGIDDRPTANPADIDGARNHVLAALSELKAGRAVSVSTSRPYGCAVKYADS
ncbi:thioredoxin family protein [Sphingosinicella sp. CPCC 101087]|uniref:thioredoxin family protein n=1 Tax=Sphingosinicella sp. CPCC 101087 TaxID=2497754 RepID=UPI001FB0EC2F|nr:thioredoxin family protein [Sphingosinicella sp. CPCC 101087]